MEKIKKLYSESLFFSIFKYFEYSVKDSFFYKSLFFCLEKIADYFKKKDYYINCNTTGFIISLIILVSDNVFSKIFFSSLFYSLISGFLMFVIVSNVIREKKDLKTILNFIFLSFEIMLLRYFISEDVVQFKICEVLIIVFPFLFVYTFKFNDGIRKYVYLSFLFISYIIVINIAKLKGMTAAFLTQLIIFFLGDVKIFSFLIFLLPLGIGSFIIRMKNIFFDRKKYKSFFSLMFAFPVGVSVWNLIEKPNLTPKTVLLYLTLTGILTGIKSVNSEDTNLDKTSVV